MDRCAAGPGGAWSGEPHALLGRDAEMAVAAQALQAATHGHGGMLLVSGETGIGKTFLCDAVSRRAAALGLYCLAGCADAHDGTRELAPLVDALRADRRTPHAAAWAAAVRHGAALAPHLPELMPSPAPVVRRDAPELFEAVLDILQAVAAGHAGLLLVVDGVQWADEASQQLLAYLARRLECMPMLVVVAYCGDDLGAQHPWHAQVAALERLHHVRHLQLAPLAPPRARQLVRATAGGLADASLDEVVSRGTGNPLLLLELAHLACDAGGDSAARPPLLTGVVRRRLEKLDALQRRILGAVSVAAPDADLRLLAQLCTEATPADVEHALEQLAGFALLQRQPGADPHRVTLPAGRFGETVAATLSGRERRALHADVAAALLARGDAAIDAAVVHLEGALQAGAALDTALSAAAHARSGGQLGRAASLMLLAHGVAMRHAELRPQRRTVAVQAVDDLVRVDRWNEVLAVAASTWDARDVLAPDQRARLAAALGEALVRGGRPAEAGRLLHAELHFARAAGAAHLGDIALSLGLHALEVDDVDGAHAWFTQAGHDARSTADEALQLRLREGSAMLAFRRTRDRAATAAMHRDNAALAERMGLPALTAAARFREACMTAAADDLVGAEIAAGHIGAATRGLARAGRALVLALQGDLDAVDDMVDTTEASTVFTAARLLATLQRGALAAAASSLRQVRQDATAATPADAALLHGLQGLLSWERGDVHTACAAFDDCAARSHRGLSLLGLGPLFVAWHVDAALRCGRDEAARRILDSARRRGAGDDRFSAASIAAAAFRLDPDAVALGKAGEAAACWPYLRALLEHWRRTLLRESADVQVAERVRALGMLRAAQRIETRVVCGGALRSIPGVHAHQERLSPREVEVAALVARGLSNAGIAAELAVSPRTVAVHISHVLGKLGFRSRAQIAGWVVETSLRLDGEEIASA